VGRLEELAGAKAIFHCPFAIYHLSFNGFRTQSTGAIEKQIEVTVALPAEAVK